MLMMVTDNLVKRKNLKKIVYAWGGELGIIPDIENNMSKTGKGWEYDYRLQNSKLPEYKIWGSTMYQSYIVNTVFRDQNIFLACTRATN